MIRIKNLFLLLAQPMVHPVHTFAYLAAHGVSGGRGLVLGGGGHVAGLVLCRAGVPLGGSGQVAGLVLGSLRVVSGLVLGGLCLHRSMRSLQKKRDLDPKGRPSLEAPHSVRQPRQAAQH